VFLSALFILYSTLPKAFNISWKISCGCGCGSVPVKRKGSEKKRKEEKGKEKDVPPSSPHLPFFYV
jgi:hypothetical protein